MSVANCRFLVMGLKGLVMRDIIGTVKQAFPFMEADTVASPADVIAQVSQSSGWKYAFLNLGPDVFVASELAALFETLGTKVILLGDSAEDAIAQSPYPVLSRPFSATDVLNLIEQNPYSRGLPSND